MDGRQQRKSLYKNKPLQVGFFFSNTNEDAYFETQDGELCIPIVEETFVSFDGRLPHRTVVMSGHVDMVGPFSLSSDVLLNVACRRVSLIDYSVLCHTTLLSTLKDQSTH